MTSKLARRVEAEHSQIMHAVERRLFGAAAVMGRRTKRRREEDEKATRPNQRWATDVMQVMIGAMTYFVVSFMDEYSRYVVHFEIAPGMDGITVSTAAQSAIDTLPKGADGRPVDKPEFRSDNGSGYIALARHGEELRSIFGPIVTQ
jgi:transposase InsO family protein